MSVNPSVISERERAAIEKMGLTWPRDASAIARRPRTDAVSHARKPLGLRPVDGPEDDETDRLISPLDGQDLERGPFFCDAIRATDRQVF